MTPCDKLKFFFFEKDKLKFNTPILPIFSIDVDNKRKTCN